MTRTTVQELLEAGVHFGAPAHTWNPRMKRFIHSKRNKIHIINLVHTVRGLVKAAHFLREVATTGRQIVYVCTKRQMQAIVSSEADRAEMPRVVERWLGGTLTNFKTVRSRLSRLEELEALEEDGQLAEMTKKVQAKLRRELRRIRKNLGGLRELSRIPGAMLVVDPKREHIAVAEAERMGVPVVAILDTDCDPAPVDIEIPGNDDSMRSVTLLLAQITDAIREGVQRFQASGRAPEDALGVRTGEGDDQPIKAGDMLASSGLAGRVAAVSGGGSKPASPPAAAKRAPAPSTPMPAAAKPAPAPSTPPPAADNAAPAPSPAADSATGLVEPAAEASPPSPPPSPESGD